METKRNESLASVAPGDDAHPNRGRESIKLEVGREIQGRGVTLACGRRCEREPLIVASIDKSDVLRAG